MYGSLSMKAVGSVSGMALSCRVAHSRNRGTEELGQSRICKAEPYLSLVCVR